MHPYAWRQTPWRCADGRLLTPREMTSEHIINALNKIERYRFDWDQGCYDLMNEARKRRLNWRFFAKKPPLHDGDLDHMRANNGWARNIRYGVDTEEYTLPQEQEIRPAEVRKVIVRFHPDHLGTIPLSDLRHGQPFQREQDNFSDVFVLTNPQGDIHDGIRKMGHDPFQFGYVRNGETRYPVVNTRTGGLYWMPGYDRVRRVYWDVSPR